MTTCHRQASATIELFFYGELTRSERAAVERHLAGCVECRRALEEMAVIRAALDARPDVSSPPSDEWSGFMARLDRRIHADAGRSSGGAETSGAQHGRRAIAAVWAAAALLALVTITIAFVLRERGTSLEESAASAELDSEASAAAGGEPAGDAALAQVSGGHFERSKLVVLGLATRDAARSTANDWSYERSLAWSLLNDTRLYRQAAEERDMKTLAGVMRDLELVLLQTAMSETPDAESLEQLQRLIRRRDLITKMDVVGATGLLP